MAYKNKEKEKQYQKQYRKTHLKERAKYEKELYKNNPTYRKNKRKLTRKSHLKCEYGLSHEDWLKIWESQDGKCLICGKKFNKPPDAYVDHNHETNKVRGLLCKHCNWGLGSFKDNPRYLILAAEYLLKEGSG